VHLTVRKLGRIAEATLDIRPLTIFVGDNNTNKTWTAYSLFGLLEALRSEAQRVSTDLAIEPGLSRAIDATVADLRARVSSLPPRGELRTTIRRHEILGRAGCEQFVFRLGAGAVRTAVAAAADPACEVQLSLDRAELERGPHDAIEIVAEPATDTLLVEYLAPGERSASYGSVLGLGDLDDAVRRFALATFSVVRCLPVERTLLAQIYPSILRSELGDVLRELPRPLIDFAYMMTASTPSAGAQPRLVELDRLSRIVGGDYDLGDVRRGLSFRFQSMLGALPLPGTASLVKSLAGLGVFLSRAKPGSILFIDEPEMNAQPRTQAMLLELLTILVHEGIRVVVTSHSPYLLDHLTNLVEASTLDEAARATLASKLFLGDARAIIRPDDVAVWGFEAAGAEVSVRSLFDRTERDIDWGLFSRVSDEVSNLYGRVLAAEKGDRS
jgi:hypothetical protein